MVQKLSFTANSITLGTGNSRVILGADSGKYYYEVKMTNNPSDSGNTGMAMGWGNAKTGERITYFSGNGYQYQNAFIREKTQQRRTIALALKIP
mgnify:CR=1 FL=1